MNSKSKSLFVVGLSINAMQAIYVNTPWKPKPIRVRGAIRKRIGLLLSFGSDEEEEK